MDSPHKLEAPEKSRDVTPAGESEKSIDRYGKQGNGKVSADAHFAIDWSRERRSSWALL